MLRKKVGSTIELSNFLQSAGLLHFEHHLAPSSLVRVVEGVHDLVLALEDLVLDDLHLLLQQDLLLDGGLQLLDLLPAQLDLLLDLLD
jgi:hypothetical protein